MTIQQDKQLSNSSYWDGRYAAASASASASDSDSASHEWFRSFACLEPFFQRNLFSVRDATSRPLILHLGSGDSHVPAQLAKRGYSNQLCVDFSPVVVALMTQRHAAIPGIEWRQADVRDLRPVEDHLVDVAFDKGTLDAMIYGSPWSPPEEVRSNTSRYLQQVYRVLKDDGFFLYITFRQPHFIRPLLDAHDLWHADMQLLGNDEGSFDYYGYVLTKKRNKSSD